MGRPKAQTKTWCRSGQRESGDKTRWIGEPYGGLELFEAGAQLVVTRVGRGEELVAILVGNRWPGLEPGQVDVVLAKDAEGLLQRPGLVFDAKDEGEIARPLNVLLAGGRARGRAGIALSAGEGSADERHDGLEMRQARRMRARMVSGNPATDCMSRDAFGWVPPT